MEPDKAKLIVSPIAYLKNLMFFQRFTSEFVKDTEFKFAYGLLLGFVDVDNTMTIENFVPIKPFDKEYIAFKKFEKVFNDLDDLNKKHYDQEFPEYILGWARNTLYNNFEPTLFDKQNQLLFQTAIHPKSVFWIFDFENLAIETGIKVFRFKGDFKEFNITSEFETVNFEFSKNVSIDELIRIAIEMEDKRKNKEVLIKGIEE